MAMLSEELSADMDRIAQLQDAILDLLTLTHTSIEYITKRTAFEQVSAAIPRTLASENTAPSQEYRAAIKTFVADIISRSKDVETLIAALPKKDDSGARAKRLEELQGEMLVANQEYKDALAQAERLLEEMQSALALALGETHDPELEETAKLVQMGFQGASSQA